MEVIEFVVKNLLILVGILLLDALFAGFGVICLGFGATVLAGIPQQYRELEKDQKVVILILGPLFLMFALTAIGLGVISFLSLPAPFFLWLGTPPFIADLRSQLQSPGVTAFISRLSTSIILGILGIFALGIGLMCLIGLPTMFRRIRSFSDVAAIPVALGLGIAFMWISILIFQGMILGTSSF